MNHLSTDVLARGWLEAIDGALEWCPPDCSTLVVVPHPDDESLSTGGLIASLRRRDVPVAVLAVTDGGAAYPTVIDDDRLVLIRRAEQRSALRELGVGPSSTFRLGVSDGGVPAAEVALERIIARMIVERRVGLVVAPWTGDHHSDHEACGRAATAAAEALSVTIAYGLFWGLFRTPDPVFGQRRLGRLTLDPVDRAAKLAAVGCHRSQITTDLAPTPMLSAADLVPTGWAEELFVVGGGTPS